MAALIFLQLYAAHLVADFLLQPDSIARDKSSIRGAAAHAGIHAACGCVFVNVSLSFTFVAGILGLSLFHAMTDFTKAKLETDGWIAFIVDQLIHLLSIIVVALLLGSVPIEVVQSAAVGVLRDKHAYLLVAAYVAIVFGGGYLVQKITKSFLATIDDTVRTAKPGLPNAGRYIGWVERALVLTLVLSGVHEGVGFLLAAKALVRYPEIKEDIKGHFAEYFLIGTLTSVGLALGGGLLVNDLRQWIR